MCDLISLTRDWTCAPAREAQSLNHWTAGEFLVWANCNLITSLRAFLVAQLVKNRLQFRRPWFDSYVGKICRRRDNRPPTPEFLGFPGDSAGKESTCNAGDLGLIPGLGRFPGKGNGCPLQYSGLKNSIDCVVHGVTESWTGLSSFSFFFGVKHSMWDLISLGIEPVPPAVEAQSLNHWTGREFLVWANCNLITSLKILSPNTVILCCILRYEGCMLDSQLCLTLYDPMEPITC